MNFHLAKSQFCGSTDVLKYKLRQNLLAEKKHQKNQSENDQIITQSSDDETDNEFNYVEPEKLRKNGLAPIMPSLRGKRSSKNSTINKKEHFKPKKIRKSNEKNCKTVPY